MVLKLQLPLPQPPNITTTTTTTYQTTRLSLHSINRGTRLRIKYHIKENSNFESYLLTIIMLQKIIHTCLLTTGVPQ